MKFIVLATFLAHVVPSSFRTGPAGALPAPQDAVSASATVSGGAIQKKRQAPADFFGEPFPKKPPSVAGTHFPPVEPDESGFADGSVDSDLSGDTPPSTQENPGRSPAGYGTGASDASVFVTMSAEDNGFLAWPSRDTAPFADPVINPKMTAVLELEPLGDAPTDITGGKGWRKTGKFYTLKGHGEVVIIKWFRDIIFPLKKKDWTAESRMDRDFIDADFISQSIAHQLSKIYSEGVEDNKKVCYVQPLLVKSEQADGVHFGFMERKFETFHRYVSPDISHLDVFDDFTNFLKSSGKFIKVSDPQGWYQGTSHLFMTDAQVELRASTGSYRPLTSARFADYDFHEMYGIVKTKLEMVNFARTMGEERFIFGVSRDDDALTIRAILAARKTQCIILGP